MFKKFLQDTTMLKVTSVSSVGVFVKLCVGFISSKVIAYFLGPQGMALMGNLQNIMQTVHTLATGGMYNGMVKYVAQFKNNLDELKKVISTSFYLGVAATFTMALVLIYGADYWAVSILNNKTYDFIFLILGASLPMYSANMLCMSIINGYGKYTKVVKLNILGNILGLGISVLLIWQQGLEGALIAMVVNPALLFLITITALVYAKNFALTIQLKHVRFRYIYGLAQYALMALVTAFAVPLVYIFVRNLIIKNLGLEIAGYWEAMNRISSYYLLFISSLMTLYILPKMSQNSSDDNFRLIVKNFFKTIMPLFISGLVAIYFLRNIIIRIVLTKEFLPMEQLFSWQLLGDFFKVASMVIAYRFHAQKMTYHFIITEVYSVLIFYLLSMLLMGVYGVKGVVMGYAINYAVYFLVVGFIFRKPLLGKANS